MERESIKNNSKEDTEITKPKLKENQIVTMFCNSKYGHVLTIDKNIFIGSELQTPRKLKCS